MDLESAERREQYKKLVRFYVLDQILLPSGEQAFCRSTDFKYVNDLLICEKINWAKEILDSIHVAASRVKIKNTKTFDACKAVFQSKLVLQSGTAQTVYKLIRARRMSNRLRRITVVARARRNSSVQDRTEQTV